MQKAASMISLAPLPASYNKLSQVDISKLDMNEIGDSDDSVTALQAQLKKE